MRLIDHLDKEQLQKLQKMKSDNKSKRKKKPERVDWHDIMGMNRDTYKRGKGGAIKSNRK